jgi:hypothetical protein
MPIKVQIMGEVAGPVVICDHCGKRIEDAKQGQYLWDVEKRDENGAMPIYFVHKGCDRLFDPTHSLAWDELDTLPILLGNNTQLNWKQAREHIKLLGSLGIMGKEDKRK